MRRIDRILFENFSYAENIAFQIIGVIPPIMRRIIYKVIFRDFGSNVHIGEKFYCRYPWKVSIGNDVNLGRSTQIIASLHVHDAYIVIEDNVMCAPNLVILGAGHDVDNPQNNHIGGSILIRRNAYIGANVTIRYGVEIGDNAVVAAGSVVTKDVPPNSIYGGNPAKLIRMK